MTFSEAISSGFSQLCWFLRPGVAIGILVLDPVHRSSQHRHVNHRSWSIVEQCDAVLIDLELGHVPTIARDGGTQAARH